MSQQLDQLKARVEDVKRAPLFIKAEAADKALAALLAWAEGIEGDVLELKQWREKSERSRASTRNAGNASP